MIFRFLKKIILLTNTFCILFYEGTTKCSPHILPFKNGTTLLIKSPNILFSFLILNQMIFFHVQRNAFF